MTTELGQKETEKISASVSLLRAALRDHSRSGSQSCCLQDAELRAGKMQGRTLTDTTEGISLEYVSRLLKGRNSFET